MEVFAFASSVVDPFTPYIQLTVGGRPLLRDAPSGIGKASIIITSTTRIKAVAWQDGLEPSIEVITGVLNIQESTSAADDAPKKGFGGLLGWWDLGVSEFAYGNYTRSKETADCLENFDTLVMPARVVDRHGALGPAVLEGPQCKGGVWDVDPQGQSACEVYRVLHDVEKGCMGRGERRVLQGIECKTSVQPSLTTLTSSRYGITGLSFDMRVNRGLYVSRNIDELGEMCTYVRMHPRTQV